MVHTAKTVITSILSSDFLFISMRCTVIAVSKFKLTNLPWLSGQRCWLHNRRNSWQPRRPITGVTHYELRRSSVGYWVKYPNTRVNGGIATAAVDLSSCKELCATDQSCIWIDWSPTAVEGQRCFIHEFSRSVSEHRTPAPGVSHYRLFRGIDGYCGKSSMYIL